METKYADSRCGVSSSKAELQVENSREVIKQLILLEEDLEQIHKLHLMLQDRFDFVMVPEHPCVSAEKEKMLVTSQMAQRLIDCNAHLDNEIGFLQSILERSEV